MNILVIEDEILIQQSLKLLLQKKGATVTCCANGKNAITMIKNQNFDKIVCDLMLQDISGFDVIEESKHKYSKEEIQRKFIIITAYCSEQVTKQAQNYGCNILKKPFNDIQKALDLMLLAT